MGAYLLLGLGYELGLGLGLGLGFTSALQQRSMGAYLLRPRSRASTG